MDEWDHSSWDAKLAPRSQNVLTSQFRFLSRLLVCRQLIMILCVQIDAKWPVSSRCELKFSMTWLGQLFILDVRKLNTTLNHLGFGI